MAHLDELMSAIPDSGCIAIFPTSDDVIIEYYGKNYCGNLEQFSGYWYVEGKGLDDARRRSTDCISFWKKIQKKLRNNNEDNT